jgi:serine/threonine-protein kinase
LWGWWRTPKLSEKPLIRLNVDLGSDVALGTSNGPGPLAMLSPDGTRLIYISRSRIFTRRLDQVKAVELAGTEGAHAPFFSPDGQWIAFFTAGKLKKIPVEGGAAIDLCDAFGTRSQGGDWSEDGKIFASLDKVVSQIPSDGGTPLGITELAKGEYGHLWPQVLPGGNAVLFTAWEGDGSSSSGSKIDVLSLKDHSRKTIQRGATRGRYLASGHLIYASRETLYAVRFDLDRLEVRGSAAALLEDVTGGAVWMVSPAGTMVYAQLPFGESTVQWLESDGKVQALLPKAGPYLRPRLSPNGERLAMETGTAWSGGDIGIYDSQRKSITPLSSARGKYPIWSPDGQYILFSDARRGGISWTRADGSGNPQPVTESKNLQYPYSFTAHGKRLAFMESNNDTAWDLWTVPVESDSAELRVVGKPEVLLQTQSDERHPVFSPDGRWLAYSSSASGGRLEIFVQPYPDASTPGRRVPISSGGGVYPIWSPNGKELFFRTLDNRVMVAAYKVQNNSFVVENPRVWSEKRLSGGGATVGNYDLAPDGKRIVAILPADPEADTSSHHVTFVMNFIDEVRRRLP